MDWNIKRLVSKTRVAIAKRLGKYALVTRPEHYQYLHEEFEPYIQNNWLLEETDRIASLPIEKICEVGCGNGKFLAEISAHIPKVTGIDWAIAPGISTLPDHVNFIKHDLSNGMPSEKFDLICSADFLEHLERPNAENLIKQMDQNAKFNFHKIACYDDGGSHLTILSPNDWLSIFNRVASGYRIEKIYDRRNNGQEVVVVTNL